MVTRVILKVLEVFHHQAARAIVVMTDQYTDGGDWEYPMVNDALEAAGNWTIKEYIQIREATVTAQVACRPIYELCTGKERMPGSSWLMR